MRLLAIICLWALAVSSAMAQPTTDVAVANMSASAIDNTSVTLREYITSLLADRDREVSSALEALNKRFDGVNEFRAQLADQAKTFGTRDQIDAVNSRILEQTKIDDALASRIAVIESSGTATSRSNTTDIQHLSDRIGAIENKDVGQNQAWGVGLAAAGLLFGFISAWAFVRTRAPPARADGAKS
jgi:hypothetical protein